MLLCAGKSAEEVVAELAADLDATAPDPYPGHAAYRDQLAGQWAQRFCTGSSQESELELIRDPAALGSASTTADHRAAVHDTGITTPSAMLSVEQAWREGCRQAYTEYIIDYGNDGRPNDDRRMTPAQRARFDTAVREVAHWSGASETRVRAHMRDAAYLHGQDPGHDTDPDRFTPPDWILTGVPTGGNESQPQVAAAMDREVRDSLLIVVCAVGSVPLLPVVWLLTRLDVGAVPLQARALERFARMRSADRSRPAWVFFVWKRGVIILRKWDVGSNRVRISTGPSGRSSRGDPIEVRSDGDGS